MKKQQSLTSQGATRQKLIKQTLEALKKIHKTGDADFLVFCKKIVSEYSYTFLQNILKIEYFYNYHKELYKKFVKSLDKKLYVRVSRDIGIKNEAYSNRLTAEVILKDRPFVVDSLQHYFLGKQYFNTIQLVYPIISVAKKGGKFSIVENGNPKGAEKYCFMIMMLGCSYTQEKTMQTMQDEISAILESLICVTNDFSAIQNRLLNIADNHSITDGKRGTQRHNLYQWLAKENMILLGLNSLISNKIQKDKSLEWKDFDNNQGFFTFSQKNKDKLFLNELQEHLVSFQQSDLSVVFIESKHLSDIHSPEPLVYIISREKEAKQERFYCLICLFTKASKLLDIMKIPLVSYKLMNIILEDNAIKKESYAYKNIRDFFNSFPKYECFRMEKDEIRILLNQSSFIWELTQIETVVYYLKKRNYARFVVYIPIDTLGKKYFGEITKLVEECVGYPINKAYWFSFGGVVQCHFVFFLPIKHKDLSKINTGFLEEQVKLIFEEWEQSLVYAIDANFSESDASKNKARYFGVFDKIFQASHRVKRAIQDIPHFNRLIDDKQEFVDVIALKEDQSRIILYTDQTYPLSQILPKLQNLSLKVIKEASYRLVIEGTTCQKNTYKVGHKKLSIKERKVFKNNLAEALLALLQGKLANENLNGLITCAGFDFQQANLFTALKKYMYQLKFSIDSNIVDNLVLSEPELASSMMGYFAIKFQPSKAKQENEMSKDAMQEREKKQLQCKNKILEMISQLKTLTEDTIFRNFFNFMEAMLRTNYYTREFQEALAFKIDCGKVLMMSNPKPLYEIFVYGVDMAGIHLRGGKIARGGLRFSDRKEDFRTEVLGLMSAQMLKNAVIVPEGSKGGFVIDEKFTTREEMFAVVEKHYRRFISALLSLTGNFATTYGEGKKVQRPENVICYDDYDPYLVVAADKGTAHLSDVANEISNTKGFWLGDAFASGGSIGYNHKEVAITAKGAWECVRVHFFELGLDIQNEHFSVVGIGDMGGDVFGNGMLLSKKILLKGAFNHVHIFIDPNPPRDDSAWKERKRLFETTGTSWLDYNKKLISKDGGIYERNSKSIALGKNLKEMLKTEKSKVSGEELIRLLLTAEVDLLWNGGIGTYIKSVNQSHADVSDPSNNNVRVDAINLRAKVVGEGGNLGLTQSARLEYSLNKGRINADSIDNSAGVNMSDNEVNIKIMLRQLMDNKLIKDEKERVKLLAVFTDEVTEACLLNNRHQSYLLSFSKLDAQKNLDYYMELVDFLVENNLIDPQKEELLTEEFILEKGVGIPRPYLCSLLSYTKMFFYRELLPSFLPDEDYCQKYFVNYFPASMTKKFSLLKYKHQLYREIITTVLINKNINQFGIPFLYLMNRWSNRSYVVIMQSYMIANDIFEGDQIRELIFTKHGGKDLPTAYKLIYKLENFLKEMTLWILLNLPVEKISFSLVKLYQPLLKKTYPSFFLEKNDSKKIGDTEILKNLFADFEKIENPLETVHLMHNQKLSKKDAENLSQEISCLLALTIGKRLINIKLASNYGKQHVGLLLQNLNSLKWDVYNLILKNHKKFASSSDDFFKFKAGGILEKLHSTEEFLVKNSKETVHLAAILIEEIKELLTKK